MRHYRLPNTFFQKKTSAYKVCVFSLSCMILAFAPLSSARAQSMDYTSLEELFGESVTTSATGKPQRMSEVPLTMDILTQDDIRRSGARNIAEALRQVNGVNVVQKTEEQYDVAIRGYNQHSSQRLLVLVNGRQVYLDYYGYTNWSSIPVRIEEIRQIEIVKGPNTALFGFNAVNGVINIVTYNPLYDDITVVGATVGTSNYREGTYIQSLKFSDKVGTRFSIGGMRGSDFDNDVNSLNSILGGSSTKAGFVDPSRDTLNSDTIFQLTDKSQMRLELSGANADEANLVIGGLLYNYKYQTRAAKISYDLDSDYGLIKANINRDFLKARLVGSANIIDVDSNVLVAQLEDTIQINPQHTIRLQAEYRNSELESDSLLAPGSEISYQDYAGSLMWNWKINDQLQWTNAARVDNLHLDHSGPFTALNPYTDDDYDQTSTEFSYNSGLVWTPNKIDTFRFSTARGLELPALLEFGLDISIPPTSFVGNPNLDSAVVTNYELAWDRKIQPIDGLFRTALFYNKTSDVKSLGAEFGGPMNLRSSAANYGVSRTYGVELSLEGTYKEHYDWGIGYIYQKTDDDLKGINIPAGQTIAKEYEHGNPEHQINLSLNYHNGPWEAGTLFYYVSGTTQFGANSLTLPVPVDVDGYVGANARVAYTFDGDLTAAVSGQQLLREQTQTSASPDIDRRIYFSLIKEF